MLEFTRAAEHGNKLSLSFLSLLQSKLERLSSNEAVQVLWFVGDSDHFSSNFDEYEMKEVMTRRAIVKNSQTVAQVFNLFSFFFVHTYFSLFHSYLSSFSLYHIR